MKKYFLEVVYILFFTNTFFGQITIRVTSIPLNTPADATLYIAGTFNNWQPGDASMRLSKNADGSFFIKINPPVGKVEYKFTRGSWQTVEGNAQGGALPNRSFNYDGTATTLDHTILTWEGQSNQTSTAASNVRVMTSNFFMPQLNRNRRIWVYLPPQYFSDSTQRYPVFYMHDGQNLFDKSTSFSGEWQVDETLNNLSKQGDKGCIVVGIDNGGGVRINEYAPWVNARYGGGEGRMYARFIVETLKPYIDTQFRTLKDRTQTAIGGSSLGGLISLFTASEYQETFSKVLVFSPSVWFTQDSLLEHIVKKGNQFPMKYYLLAGGKEDNGSVVQDLYKVEKMFIGIGYNAKKDYLIVPKEDGEHSEWFWAREFGNGYKWLFGNLTHISNTQSNADSVGSWAQKVEISPNPTDSIIQVLTKENTRYVNICVFDIYGRLLLKQPFKQNVVDLSFLKSGVYVVSGFKGSTLLFSKKVVKR